MHISPRQLSQQYIIPRVAKARCVCLTHRIAIPIDKTFSVAINMNALSSNNKPSMVILESNWVRVVSPVVEVIRQLKQKGVNKLSRISDMRDDSPYRPDTFPINGHIVDDRIELRPDPVVFAFWKDYCSTMVALLECIEDLRCIISLAPEGFHRAGPTIAEWANWNWERTKRDSRGKGSKSNKHGLGKHGMHDSTFGRRPLQR
jgi:hypothetical protein